MNKMILFLLFSYSILFPQEWLKAHLYNVRLWEIPEILDPPSFKPTDIENCVVWLDGMDDTTVIRNGSNKVSTWENKANTNYNFNQGEDTRKPTYSQIEKELIFNQNYLVCNNSEFLSNPTDITIFFIFKSALQWGVLIAVFSQSNNDRVFLAAFEDAKVILDFGNYIDTRTTTTQLFENYAVLTAKRVGGTITLNKNGTTVATRTGATSQFTNRFRSMYLGVNDYYFNAWLKGSIKEVIIFNRGLSDNEVGQIESYLNDKWSIY